MMKSISTWKQELTEGAHAARLAALYCCAPEQAPTQAARYAAVLDGLDLNDPEVRLFAVDRTQQGHTSVRRIVLSQPLHQLLHNYPLSRLWMMGHLGAVPNV